MNALIFSGGMLVGMLVADWTDFNPLAILLAAVLYGRFAPDFFSFILSHLTAL